MKKIKKAVALYYNKTDEAPKIIAKGQGIIAEKLIKKAKEENIIIYEDSNLIESLIQLNLKDEIPEDLYQVVAEIIFYVYSIDEEKRKKYE